jgi:nucleotide-binding universal stress UspA family protein
MYKSIYVPVDNSDHSNRAVSMSLELGKAFESKLVGSHVYAAKMHDYRFKQMEFTLPEEYLEENELHRQRKIHDSLITMGLELISDCYLTDMGKLAEASGLQFEPKMMDGKHSTELIKDIEAEKYDLVVLGALGIGRTRDAQIGSVCQRITREVDRDVWVVKHLPKKDEAERDTILVGVDGSPESFGALLTAIDLAEKLGKKLELISVYDPYLHYAVFKGIVDVLTDKAAKVFRFEEQNQLHEEIIDTGLAEIYQSHLNVAEAMARDKGVEVQKTLLDGKAFQKVLDHARKVEPYLLVIGRVGVHTAEEDGGLGSNTENLLRLTPCDILLTNRRVTPELDLRAEESIHWTPESEERMTRVPEQVKGIARTAILRLALEQGHSVVTSDLVTEAMERFMPKASQRATAKLAETLAFEKAKQDTVAACKKCGTVALVANPVQCTMCDSTDFDTVTPEMVDAMVEAEGGALEETTYDGRKLRWSQEARKALRSLGDSYQRRRAKARIEKSARSKRLDTITLDFAQRFVEEEAGVLYRPAEGDEALSAAEKRQKAKEDGTETVKVSIPEPEIDEESGLKILARDSKNNPLISRLDWTEKAIERVLRVPAGFMRSGTQERIEELAAERGTEKVDIELVEAGIKVGLQMMEKMIGSYGGGKAPQAAKAKASSAKPPAASNESSNGDHQSAKANTNGEAVEDCPVPQEERAGQASKSGRYVTGNNGDAAAKPALNEVSVLSEMEKRRAESLENPESA